MNLQELRAEAWAIARETGTSDEDRLWTSLEMNRYINRTHRYIARETLCIRDAITPAVCRITVAPYANISELETAALTNAQAAQDLVWYNTEGSWFFNKLVAPYVVPLHPSILDILEVKWSTTTWRLNKVSVSKWQVNPWWEQTLAILPTEYATDYSVNTLALNTRFSSSDVLRLIVIRMPLNKMSKESDSPEFREQYHDFMLSGILMQMYSKQDANTLDIKKADQYALEFAKDVDDIKQQERILNQMARTNSPLGAFL